MFQCYKIYYNFQFGFLYLRKYSIVNKKWLTFYIYTYKIIQRHMIVNVSLNNHIILIIISLPYNV